MTFVQIEFLGFFAIVFTLYWGWRNLRWQNRMLLVASAIFYGWVHFWFVYLLLAASTVDYLAANAIERYPQRRKLWLVLSLVNNLGLLGFFKYFDFFIENVAAGLQLLGVPTSLHTLGIFLPVGISFYTFQTISYVVDVYRGQLRARSNYWDYQLFVCFFPQLVAGPIERAGNLLTQLEKPRTWNTDLFLSGITLAMWGAVKKVCVADVVAPYVDKVFVLNEPSGPLVWAGVLGFAVQVLADFSGYTDIARGTARMMGFELMKNFGHPYLARSPAGHWKNFHISFTSWVRDYLYFPLGGSRVSNLRAHYNTWITMLLSGLWHGAGWNYILWGAWQSLIMSVWREAGPRVPSRLARFRPAVILMTPVMFCCTCFGYMLFRTPTLGQIAHNLSVSPFSASPEQWIATVVLVTVCIVFSVPQVVAMCLEFWAFPRLEKSRWLLPAQTTFWAMAAVAIFFFKRMTNNDFIYFQF